MALILLSVAEKVSATSIVYDFDHTLAGNPPAGPTPWLRATFTDVSPGSVQLTLSALGLTGTEHVNQWYFNLNPALDPSALHFSPLSAVGSFTAPSVAAGADSFKPDHDGKYDLRFNFSSGGGLETEFSGGDSVTFSITGLSGLQAADFIFGNTPAAGHGSLLTAAYIDTVGEAIVIDAPPSIPDRAVTITLFALALIGLFYLGRKGSVGV